MHEDRPLIARRRLLAGFAAATLAGPAAAAPRRVVLFGDSIAAGYGLPAKDALPARLAAELAGLGWRTPVTGAGKVGDTTASAAARAARVARTGDLCVVALGANDLLRGFEPASVKANLDLIVRRLRGRGARVVLAGVGAPRLLGGYGSAFDQAFAAVARAHRLPFLPDMLGGVALNPALNQKDGIHPNAAGVRIIARRLAPVVARGLQAG